MTRLEGVGGGRQPEGKLAAGIFAHGLGRVQGEGESKILLSYNRGAGGQE